MIGTTLGHYHILEKLGEGGMGIVYGVEDTKLHRRVALKILPRETASSPERLARFEREVRSVAALDHPNIVTIYSVEDVGGVNFFTMEWVRGQSLSRVIPMGGMSQEEILAIAIPMASAVAAAHRRGITHRDLKPDNVMIGEGGRLKILDFGLAKLDDSAASREGMTVAASGSVTQEGKILGTVSYMSPEQAEGKPVDARSDVFSLGIVLYEMATGKRPFAGDNPISTLSAILRDTPPSVDVVKRGLAPEFARIVQRCLEKDPNRRFSQAQDLFVELQSLQQKAASGTLDRRSKGRPRPAMLAAAALGVAALAALAPFAISRMRDRGDSVGNVSGRPVREASLAILPFTNASHDPANEPITNGIHDDLLTQVSKIAAIKVISRTSVMEYKDTSRNLKKIAEELDVAHVLEGSVQRSGDRVRINVQLIDADTDRHLWAETYDRELTARNIFEIQGEIARTVAGQLQATLMPHASARFAAVPTENLDAYELYRRGITLNDEHSDAQSLLKAAELFEQALKLDPKFAVAAAELGNQHAFIYWMYFDHTEERMDRAKAAIDRAFELSPGLIEAHVALGYYYYWRYLDYDRALQEFGKALEQEPNNMEAIRGTGSVLRRKGRFPEALNMYRRALELDPRSVNNVATLAETLGLMRQFEEADRTYARRHRAHARRRRRLHRPVLARRAMERRPRPSGGDPGSSGSHLRNERGHRVGTRPFRGAGA